MAHDAYLTMPPSAQLILIDFKRHVDVTTEFGLYPFPKTGIPYSYGHCIVDVHRNTFRKSLNLLEDRGFLLATGQRDIDGESDYYTVGNLWRKWEAPEKDRKRMERLRARILRRENLDRSPTCTFLVHPPAPKNANPLLNFWAVHPDYLHKKSAALPIGSEKKDLEHARTRVKQELSQEQQAELEYAEEQQRRNIIEHNFRAAHQ